MLSLIKNRLTLKKLGIVQVEVSTFCQLNCAMCPKTIFKKDWISKHMELELFQKIPFELFKTAHLQGWGEPLMNPNIIEMIDTVKKKNCTVGLTTNGLLLKEFAKDLVEKIDYIAISLASTKEEVHRKIRKTSLHDLVKNIKFFTKLRTGDRPKVTLVTMMLEETLEDLPKFVDLAVDCGTDEIIVNNLDYIPSSALEKRAVFLGQRNPKISEIIENSLVRAKKAGIRMIIKSVKLEEVSVCAENPINNCLITVDGALTPCVYLHLPTRKTKIKRFFRGQYFEIKKVYFGNLKETSFKKIWYNRDYKEFRHTFEKRLRASGEFLVFDFPELPEYCQTCYKSYGI